MKRLNMLICEIQHKKLLIYVGKRFGENSNILDKCYHEHTSLKWLVYSAQSHYRNCVASLPWP